MAEKETLYRLKNNLLKTVNDKNIVNSFVDDRATKLMSPSGYKPSFFYSCSLAEIILELDILRADLDFYASIAYNHNSLNILLNPYTNTKAIYANREILLQKISEIKTVEDVEKLDKFVIELATSPAENK